MAIETKPLTGAACWSCGAQREERAHFCSACGKVQPGVAADHFSFFGLPRKLALDAAALEREFYRLSRKLHPDLYARATEEERRWSLEKSSQLNDAYRALKDPVARTEHLLALEGVQLEEQSKAATDRARATGEEKKQVVPPELLEEVFEFNMQLEELRLARKMGEDDSGVVEELATHRENFGQMLKDLGDELRSCWKQWDALPFHEHADTAGDGAERRRVRDKMVDLLNRRSYIRNLVRDVNQALGN